MAGKQVQLVYVELKSGYSDNGPAWIGWGRFTRTGRSLYFHDKMLQACKGGGIAGNFFDVETGEEYWVSGPKKDGRDRHRHGGGPVQIDDDAAGADWSEIRGATARTNH
ncbi:MAG: hypothetical protein IT424_13270 [Pirellulales bacterium]|nr:hypothetical protein [Pirellulales bacterium]